jgi:hypothetical protein
MIVGKASNASEATSSKTMGLIESSLSQNGQGVVITEGLLAGLNTTGANAAGDPVWLGTDGNLIYGLTNKPYAPAHLVFIGIVTRINANNGEIFVKVQNGFELDELHNVDLKTTTPINGHILGYDGTLWVNKTIAGWLGFTPVTNARTLTINGTSYDLSADRTWTINSMVYPSAGIAVSTGTAWGTSITDNSSNWNTAYGWGNHASAGYVPGARTLTINGTTYDLTANRSWTIDSTTAATRTIQKFTSTSNQSVFTITGGYTVGMVDVYVNGVKLDNAGDFTATNGTTVTLTDALIANQIVEVYKFGSQFIPNNALRQVTTFTATAGQTTFTVNYSVGLVDVYYNGSCLAQSEYTAINGTSIILATACQVNDIVVVYAYSYSVGAYSGIGGSVSSGYVSKATATNTLGNSGLYENTNNYFGINTTNAGATLPSGTGWTTQPASVRLLQINSTNGNANSGLFLRQTDNSTGLDLWSDNYYGDSYIDSRWNNASGNIYIRLKTAGTPNTAMTINGNGNIAMGSTDTTQGRLMVQFSDANNNGIIVNETSGAANAYMAYFFSNSVAKGSIKINSGNTGVNFNTTASDLRLKKNIEDWDENVSEIFKNAIPKTFNFNYEEDNAEKTKGFIAQDLFEYFPEAYPLDENGYHSFNPSGMVVYLMKAIQELKAEVEELRQIVATK